MSLPHEDFLYLGDTARFPYGDRSPEELRAFARELAGDPARSAAPSCSWWRATRPPRRRCPRCARSSSGACRWWAWCAPESRLAAAATRNGRVGLIATPATVASGAYARALAEAAPDAELHAVASAELAPLIQAGGEVDHRTLGCVEGACRPLKRAGVDTVILGCTHYPLVRPRAAARAGPRRRRSSARARRSPPRSSRAWRRRASRNDEGRRGDYRFLATGDPEEFRRAGHALPASCRSARSSTWTWPARPPAVPAPPGAPHEHGPAQRRPHARRPAPDPHRHRASCAPPPARR